MGDTKQSISKAGLFKILYNPATETILILDNSITQEPDWSKSISPTSLMKADGTYYRTYSELINLVPDFFSDIPITNPSGGQYHEYVEQGNTLKSRYGIRDGNFVVDKELTATGFAGTESTDDGVTGDWINISYNG